MMFPGGNRLKLLGGLGGFSSQHDLGDADRELVLKPLHPRGSLHRLIILLAGIPRFIPRPSALNPDAKPVGTPRLIAGVLAEVDRAFFHGAGREVSRQFGVFIVVGLNERLSLG